MKKQTRKTLQFNNSELADLLEMLCMSVSAGCSIEVAFSFLAQLSNLNLSKEITQYLNEIRLGETNSQALCNLADRIQNPYFHRAAKFMLLAQYTGASFIEGLRGLILELRTAKANKKVKLQTLKPLQNFDF